MNFLSHLIRQTTRSLFSCNVDSTVMVNCLVKSQNFYLFPSVSPKCTLEKIHKRAGKQNRQKKSIKLLDGNPFMKGVVLKNFIKKPNKPNSANRKCVMVRLTNGREMAAYVPGIGHNLQEHNVVLVRPGKLMDCTGVKLKCVRGKYDLGHVIKRPQQ